MITAAEFTGDRCSEKNYSEPYTIPPSSLTAEQAVLGALVVGSFNDNVEQIIPTLKPDHFYSQGNRLIYDCIVELHLKNVRCDLVALRNTLDQRGKLDSVGGVDYLMDICEATPGPANAEYYANIVRDKAVLRSMIQTADGIRDACFDPAAEPGEVIESAEQSLLSVTTEAVQSDTTQASDITMGVVDEILNRKAGTLRGLPTGFDDLDQLTHGFKEGEMTIIAARTSMGKTSLMLNTVEHIAVDKNVPVAIFSLEMTDAALIERMLSSRAGVDLHNMSSGRVDENAEQKLQIAAEEIHAAPIHIESCRDLTALSLRTKARRLVRQHGVKLIVVDYLQLIHAAGGRQDRYLQIGEISRALKALAVELNVAVLALSQLNRLSEQREGNRPRISDLRESGNIEQDADVVLLIHRPGAHNKDEVDNVAEIIVGKNRNGPVGSVHLKWSAQYARFDNQPQFGDNS